MPSSSQIRLFGVLLTAAGLRLALFAYEPLVLIAGDRLELATPNTSWKSCETLG